MCTSQNQFRANLFLNLCEIVWRISFFSGILEGLLERKIYTTNTVHEPQLIRLLANCHFLTPTIHFQKSFPVILSARLHQSIIHSITFIPTLYCRICYFSPSSNLTTRLLSTGSSRCISYILYRCEPNFNLFHVRKLLVTLNIFHFYTSHELMGWLNLSKQIYEKGTYTFVLL